MNVRSLELQATVTIHDMQWQVSVATTLSELTQGLGGLPSIPANTGMLFDLGYETIITVTTEPMLFPLDIVFISGSLVVVDIARNIQPGCLVTSDVPVRYFLEVNAGELSGVAIGDTVVIQGAQVQPHWTTDLMAFASTAMMIGLAGAVVVGMVRSNPGEFKPRRWTELAVKVIFIGSCKVSESLCLTHGYSVSRTVKCPQSPLTDEEWKAAWELAETAWPEGMHNPWVDGWWPETLEEAERTVESYTRSMRYAVRKYREIQWRAFVQYEMAADKAIYNYRQYVMREYERRPKEAIKALT